MTTDYLNILHAMALQSNTIVTGEQDTLIRQHFLQNRCKKCYNCKSLQIIMKEHVSGVRFNGDAYGTHVFTCNSCGWKTSLLYDDGGEPYYYEFRLTKH